MTRRAVHVPRSSRLLNAVAEYPRVVVVMHDNPDPDAIAAGWAIQWMIQKKLGQDPLLIGGGEIIRAENREMVRLLKPPLRLVEHFDAQEDTAAILVDCGLEAGNHLLASKSIRPVAVIDHHTTHRTRRRLSFQDIRPRVAASASIAASYLREQMLEPPAELATAMLYAIRTETRGNETHHSRLDRSVLGWLTERADPSRLAEIENAPLSREYFADLVLALQSTFLYDDAALCLLPRAQGPETVGEVADLLIRCEQVQRVLCGAVIGDNLLLSVRTGKSAGSAAQLVRETLEGFGQGGGHAHRAGGKIPLVSGDGVRMTSEIQDVLRQRWLAACGTDRRRGTRLVAKREIVDNL